MTVLTFPGAEPPTEPPAELRCIEPSVAPEFFCTDLARVHVYGSVARLTFTAPDVPIEAGMGCLQNIVTVKMIVPIEKLQEIYEKIGQRLPPAEAEGAGDPPPQQA